MKELWDIYDENRVLTGRTHERGVLMKSGDYHLVVEIWTVNEKGQILLTKRHPDKHFGGLWESTGGSAVAGEDSLTGAQRELSEETGIRANEGELRFLGSIKRQNSFFDTYLIIKSIELKDLKLQTEEVTDAKWVALSEFNKMCADGQIAPPMIDAFHVYHEKLLSYLK